MMQRPVWIASLLTTTLLLAGCRGDVKPPGELITSQKLRDTTPDAPAEDLAAVVAGNSDFAAALYREAARPGENLFFSPLSITEALSMLWAGARGNTEAQMAQALHLPLPQERFHPAMNALDLALQSRAAGAPGEAPELRFVNSIWVQSGAPFEAAYLDVLAEQYGAGVRAVDFIHQAEPLRERINEWVAQQTHDRIRDLLPQGALTADTRLVLTNVLYFKGLWASPFPSTLTQPAPFHRLDGSTVQVQMMKGEGGSLARMQGDGFQAVALPYKGNAFRMLLIVPDEGRFGDVEAQLSAAFLGTIRQALAPRGTALQLPRFEVRTELALKGALSALGMQEAFTDAADLGGMSQAMELSVQGVQHQAFVAVTEAGTEAAAATGVSAGTTSVPEPLVVDRPFLFLIEDRETGAVLFLGRLLAP